MFWKPTHTPAAKGWRATRKIAVEAGLLADLRGQPAALNKALGCPAMGWQNQAPGKTACRRSAAKSPRTASAEPLRAAANGSDAEWLEF